jgi:hypothetical protein
MPNNVVTVMSGGFWEACFYLLDTDGYVCNTSGTLSASTATGGYLMRGVRTAAYKAVEPLVLTGVGEDQFQGHIVLPQQEAPAFDLTCSVSNLTVDGLAQTTNVVALGNASLGVIQPTLPIYVDMAAVFWRHSISKDSATTGSSNWDGVIFPKVQAVPMGADGISEKKITDYKWHIITNPTTILPTGNTVTSLAFNTTSAPYFQITSPHRLRYFAWLGDGTATKNIAKTAITLATGYPNYTCVAGTPLAPGGVTVTTDTNNYIFTFDVAPAAGQRVVTMVEVL